MPIELKKDGEFLNEKFGAGIDLRIDEASAIAKSIANNTALPADAVIDLQGSLSAKTGDIHFGGGGSTGTVSFKAGVSGGLIITKSASDLQKKLTSDEDTLAALVIPKAGVARFGALRWGYDIAAAAKGSVALGVGGSVKFGVNAQSAGEFVVARAWEKDPTGADAVASLFKAWRLPTQISSPDQLEPGTWIAAEVDGEFAASVGAKFGYDYSWIRTVNAAGLSGDVGLKIQAAAAVTVGFNAAGKYLLIVARESLDPTNRILRVRLSKLNRKGWDFALDANVKVTPSTGKFLPAQMDDFLKAVFGVHGPQLVKDLQTFRDWVDPSTPLAEKFAGFVSHYAVNKLNDVAGSQLQAARTQISKVLNTWDNLPSKVSSLLWDQIGAVGLADLEPWLRKVASSDSASIKEDIKAALGTPLFFSTSIGAWLNTALEGKLLDAALKSSAAATVKDIAKKTLAVLDGDVIQQLVDFANEHFAIDKIKQAVALTDPSKLEPWVASKLSEFIGAKIDLKGLEQVRKTLFTMLDKAQDLYDAALKSLNKTYGFAFHFEYAQATTKTALFDAEFDFAVNPALGTFVRAAIDGDWTSMLLHPMSGIALRGAVLTHGIKRTSAVEVTLPYFNSRIDRINESLAKLTVVDDGGRVLLYDLKAKDSIKARNKWQSALTITGKIGATAAGVRNFGSAEDSDEAFRYSYSFRIAARDVRTMQLENRIQPLVKDLFPKAFQETSLHEWSLDLDKAADDVERQSGGIVNGTGKLGDVLASLEVVAPGRAVAAWLKAPADKNSDAGIEIYRALSANIQTQLRRLIPLVFFTDMKVYDDSRVSAPFLIYPCLPILRDPRKGFYGDVDAPGILALVNDPDTRLRFGSVVGKVHAMLVDIGSKKADLYDPANKTAMDSLLRAAATSPVLGGLLFKESEAVKCSIDASLALAEFTEKSASEPEKALEALATFGEKLTETFNSKLSTLPGPAMRQLGTVVFLEASRAFDPELAKSTPVARLVVTLLRNSADNSAAMKAYVNDGEEPNLKLIAMQQPIVAF